MKSFKSRYLTDSIEKLALNRNKMAFISGPRQSGKTTLARSLMERFDESTYQNWDESKFRKLWTKSPNDLQHLFKLNESSSKKLLILDEIHKSRQWKQKLKGIYDHLGEIISIIVTGSARLNVYNKGGDSLMGRYVHFRLHPFSVAELLNNQNKDHLHFFNQVFTEGPNNIKAQDILEELFKFGGFPEPYLEKDEAILNIWQRGRLEKVVKQDLLDLTRVQEISHVEALMSLLPEKVGSPLSTASLREDLEVAFDTAKRWLSYLEELYYSFTIRPYSKSIIRSLKKEPKLYLYDWTEVEDNGFRFENLVASHLLKSCHYWEDTGQGKFDLHYLRDKQKTEVDFLVTKNKKPWFTIECKFSDSNLDVGYKKYQSILKTPHIQLIYSPKQWRKVNELTWIMSAEYFLPFLV